MPLTPIQRQVIRVIREFRDEHDYVAGRAALNRNWPRQSDDMDIFHDRRRQLPDCVDQELQALRDAGFAIELIANDGWMVEAILRQYGTETKLQWLDDEETSRRFFPAVEDEEFGFRLHQADNAVNKVLCASRRRAAPRDAIDLVNISRRYAPLGPLIWAAVGKIPGMAPPAMIRDIRGIAFGYSDEELTSVRMDGAEAITRAELHHELGRALDDAADYCDDTAPAGYGGCLFVDADEVPVAADENAIAAATAKAMALRDYSLVPTVQS